MQLQAQLCSDVGIVGECALPLGLARRECPAVVRPTQERNAQPAERDVRRGEIEIPKESRGFESDRQSVDSHELRHRLQDFHRYL